MSFTVRALKARHGDAFLLLSDKTSVLVDGGPSRVFETALRPELEKLRKEEDTETAKIDLLVVSHIDDDHIVGILDLTSELIDDRDERRQSIVEVRRAWHNSFSDMIKDIDFEGALPVRDYSGQTADIMEQWQVQLPSASDTSMVMASVGQGRRLRQDLKTLNIRTNMSFEGGLVKARPDYQPWKKRDLSLTVVGPTDDELKDLRKKWKKELPKLLEKEARVETADAVQKIDRSVSNIASIVFIAESGGKQILMTGDARHDKIMEWLLGAGTLDSNGQAHFDGIKMAHHGSERNASPEFFQKITANHYIVSGNGGHGNPDPRVFEWLLEARPDRDYQIHMTYSLQELSSHKSFQKYGNDEALSELMARRENRQNKDGKPLFVWPSKYHNYIDIIL